MKPNIKRSSQGYTCITCGAIRLSSIRAKQHNCTKQKRKHIKRVNCLESPVGKFYNQARSKYV